MCPLDFSVDEKVVQDHSTEDEDRTVQVLHGWLIDDGSQDQVAGQQSQHEGQNNRNLQGPNSIRKDKVSLLQLKDQKSKNPRAAVVTFRGRWRSFLVKRMTMRASADMP